MDQGEVWDYVIYHPRLDTTRYTPRELPKISEMLLFANGQRPNLEQVVTVDNTESLPITVILWNPNRKEKNLSTVKYAKRVDEGSSILVRVRPEQILLVRLRLTEEGFFLDEESQRRFRKSL